MKIGSHPIFSLYILKEDLKIKGGQVSTFDITLSRI